MVLINWSTEQHSSSFISSIRYSHALLISNSLSDSSMISYSFPFPFGLVLQQEYIDFAIDKIVID